MSQLIIERKRANRIIRSSVQGDAFGSVTLAQAVLSAGVPDSGFGFDPMPKFRSRR